MEEPFLTSRELAERWKFNPTTLKKWRCRGKGPHYHKMEKSIRYYVKDIEIFEKAQIRHHTSMTEAPPLVEPIKPAPPRMGAARSTGSNNMRRRIA